MKKTTNDVTVHLVTHYERESTRGNTFEVQGAVRQDNKYCFKNRVRLAAVQISATACEDKVNNNHIINCT